LESSANRLKSKWWITTIGWQDCTMFEPMSILQIRMVTDRLVLRSATDHDLAALSAVFPDDLDFNPSLPVHSGLTTKDARMVSFLQDHWRNRGTWTVDEWRLDLVVEYEGDAVGIAGLDATQFPARRVLETSSWLSSAMRGKGLGKEMRCASLTLGFDHLGALEAHSDATDDNVASIGVSTSLGYEPNGEDILITAKGAQRLQRFRMTRAAWQAVARPPVRIEYPQNLLGWFGVSS
jgi:RimJ/RimL family protein N-acetyltransferase